MRRRRQKNTLLPKMIGIAVLVNAILLPILAQMGVFKGMRGSQHLTEVQLVQAPPPPPKPKTPQRKAVHHPPHHQEARRQAPRETQRIARADNTPKVNVVAAGSGAGSGPGNSGIAQTGTPEPPPPVQKPIPPQNPTPPPPINPPVQKPTPPQNPTPPPINPPTPPPPHVPVLVQASVAHRVDPQVPADFSDQNLPVAFHAVFDVHADGTATVSVASGTGDKSLDQVALDAARQWTFKPATEDGKPVESYLRLTINFVPSDSS